MAARRKKGDGGLSNLIRKAGRDVKITEGSSTREIGSANIFNILDYIEQPWGLWMDGQEGRSALYPSQRFIVKLYYDLPLDTRLPDDPYRRIQVTDMFNTKVLYEFTEAEYLTFLYNEGRCNIGEQDHSRRELILAIGRRSGKCVEGDTLVLTDKGIFRIEELSHTEEDTFEPLEIGVVQEAGRRATSTAFYNGGVKHTFRIKSFSGYTVCGTGNHRVKVLSTSGRVEWRYLDEVQAGDVLAVNRGTDLWASEPLDLWPFAQRGGYKEVDLPEVLNEDLGRLLGYLVGDGTWGDGHAVSMTVEHHETWEEAKTLFTQFFGGYRVQMDKRASSETGRLEFCSVAWRRFLDDLGWSLECDRYNKMVPWSILRSPKSVICAFLRGLFETDGCVESQGKRVTLSTASFRLAHEVQTLLLNIGIVASVRPKWVQKTKRHYAILGIKGLTSRRLFAQLIGFDSAKKRDPMLAGLETAEEGKSNTDSVPHQCGRLRDLLEATPRNFGGNGARGWKRSKLRAVLGNTCKPGSNENITYSRMKAAVDVATELGTGAEETQHFRELLRLNYFYDKIESVVEGEDHVYDLTVPDGGSFVANGLTNHNTTLSGIFASYEVYRLLNLYNPQSYYGLPNGNRIQIISVATDKDQAGLLFNEVTSHLAKCEYFKPFIVNNTLGWVNFRTPYDIEKFGPTMRQQDGRFVSFNGKATMRVTFKSCIAKGLRGSGNVVVILDEVAHFMDKGNSSAKEIYDAVTPSQAAFSRKDPNTRRPVINAVTGEEAPVESRCILISSPLGKSGKFYEKFELAMHAGEGAQNILAIQAPTWEINPTVPSAYYKEKYHEDPVTFMTEFGARFSDQMSGWIERESDLLSCVQPDRRPVMQARPKMPHQMGLDVGLIGDGTAIAITHVDGDQIILDYHEVWYAGVDWKEANPHLCGEYPIDYAKTLANVERLDFDEIAKWILTLCKRFHITEGLFDRWNGIPLEQTLHKQGHRQFKAEFFTRDMTSKLFQAVKMFIFDERLVLYDWPIPERGKEGQTKHSILISELLSLQAKQISKNIVLVEAPKKKDAHDDISDALIRAVWLSMEAMLNQKHAARGGAYRPHTPTAMTVQRYQAIRARKHGGYGQRNPRAAQARGRRVVHGGR